MQAEEILRVLKENIDADVRITCRDGEIMVVQILLVSDEDQDVICFMGSSTQPAKYATLGANAPILVTVADIDRVELTRVL